MIKPNAKKIEELRKKYPRGTRIRLVNMDDDQAPPVGTLGTVSRVDDAGSILVDWDNGSHLNVIYRVDTVELVEMDKYQKVLAKLPCNIRERIDYYRKGISDDILYNESAGYVLALYHTGRITDSERKSLISYIYELHTTDHIGNGF